MSSNINPNACWLCGNAVYTPKMLAHWLVSDEAVGRTTAGQYTAGICDEHGSELAAELLKLESA